MTDHDSLVSRARTALSAVGVDLSSGGEMAEQQGGVTLMTRSPISGTDLFPVAATADVAGEIERAHAAFAAWRDVPAPVRGRVVKRLGVLIEQHKESLADLVTIEAGKIRSEALGEVQEMIDICDLAVGLSRQLNGRTMPSERPGHRLQESWQPLGVVGVISAFNFPVAVWSWNTAIALVCGDTVVWKPSELTSMCALACAALLDQALVAEGHSSDVHRLVLGDRVAGEALVDDARVALVSATGSTRMGREVGPRVAARFGRSLLELGGNNAVIVTPSADLDIAVPSMVFAAAGTAGQRCTSQRRLLVHHSIADEVCARLERAFASLTLGDPFAEDTLVGPLVSEKAADTMASALEQARAQGGTVVGGDRVDLGFGGAWVRPALVRIPAQEGIVLTETFAPILYVLTYDELDEALALHNAVAQGLSGGIFTRDQAEAERYLAVADTGIANVNAGTSGAEIGGAFGGEKETGGGRESGSDAWRAYMRRQTTTINYSGQVVLAQGVDFG